DPLGRGRARQVSEASTGRPAGAGAGGGLVPHREAPERLGAVVHLAVSLAVARTDAAGPRRGAADLREVGHRVGRVGRALGPVDVAHAGARGAGVAVSAAVRAAEEAVADTGAMGRQRGGEVTVGLAGSVL